MEKHTVENHEKGRKFQEVASIILGKMFGVQFDNNVAVPIGNPLKDHKFDLVSRDRDIICECKNYSWTKSGNVPSAKMACANEAVFYLSFLGPSVRRFMVFRRDLDPRRSESLASYYYRTYSHLLGNIIVLEIDFCSREVRALGTKL